MKHTRIHAAFLGSPVQWPPVSGFAIVTVLMMLGMTTLIPATVSAQWTYQVGQSSVTGTPEAFFSVASPLTCSDGSQNLPNGGYLKRNASFPYNTPLIINSAATNEGTCLAYLYGNYNNTQLHGINYIAYTRYNPGSSVGNGPIRFWAWGGSSPYPLSYDSRNPPSGATGSYTEHGFSYLGEYRLTFVSLVIATGCGFPSESAIAEKTVNVVACKPEFTENSAGTTTRMPTDDISIYVPSTMSYLYQPVDDAASDWTNALAGSGVTLNRVTTPCSGASCINVLEGTVPLTACAQYAKYPDQTTGINSSQPAEIILPSAASSRTAARNQRSLAHELGHLLGLDDQPSTCGSNSSVMTIGVACDAQSGFSTAPSLTNALPAKNSSFGGGPKVSCGF